MNALARRCGVYGLLALLVAGWVTLHFKQVASSRWGGPARQATLVGVVSGLPRHYHDATAFQFHPERIDSQPWRGGAVLAHWYRDPPQLRPGERWHLTVRLKPPAGRVNFQGPDPERAWFGQRISALASVREGQRLGDSGAFRLDRKRDEIRLALASELAGLPGQGLVIALSLGDRGFLDAGLRDALAVTGTAHLLAVSGLHVGLVALFGFGVGRLLCFAWPVRWARWPACTVQWGFAVLFAGSYAALSGFSTSTRRALIMLAVWAIFGLSKRRFSSWAPWCLSLLVVVVLNPLSIVQAGFWLSFGAVAVLLMLFSTRRPQPRHLGALVLAQTGIGLVMLPLGMYGFGLAGGGGWLVNLVAIPWVSLVNLPLVLLGVCAWWLGLPLGEGLLYTAEAASAGLLSGLETAARVFGAFSGRWRAPAGMGVVLAAAGAAWLMSPRGLPMRWVGLFLLAPLFLPPARGLAQQEWRLELLDVGQGLAALVETRNHLMLVDTGPGLPGTWDLFDAVLEPAVTARGRLPDTVLVSHGDLDHAGALARLRERWPSMHVLGNAGPRQDPQMAACHDQRYWRWDGVRFTVLHPGRWLPYLGNDSSCVLAATGAGGRLLLPGDIGHRVEQRLVSREPGHFRVLVAPHHGSRRSTTSALLRWAAPEVVLSATGIANRFGFPHPEVAGRVEAEGAVLLDTAACGAIRATMAKDGQLELSSARRHRAAPWRWPANASCP